MTHRVRGRGALVRSRRAAFTLVELSVLLGLVGVALAVMIPAFVRQVHVSKLAEASDLMDAMRRGVTAYHGTPQRTAKGVRLGCAPISAGPTPSAPSTVPNPVDFQAAATEGSDTWRAIRFQPDRPIRYAYTLRASAPGCGLRDEPSAPGEPTIKLRAEGDLDGDGHRSLFELDLVSRDGVLVAERPALVRDRVE
jgi:type II secretory pathway pseudopilin PulG